MNQVGQQKQMPGRQMNEFQLKLGYSHSTLEPLSDPCLHENYGCQFNYDEFKGSECPVCQRGEANKIIKDTKFRLENELKNERQLILDTGNQQLYQTYKSKYSDSNISKVEEVLNLQKTYNSKILLKSHVKLEEIIQMNNQKNQEYFQLIKKIRDDIINQAYQQRQQPPEKIEEIIPILMSVIDQKLILFYHKYKIKLELELFDETNARIKPKIKSTSHGEVVQIVYFQGWIYFLFQKQETYSVFFGNFQNIFNQNEAKFFIKKVQGSEKNSFSKLFCLNEGQKDQKLVIIGNGGFGELSHDRQLIWSLDYFLNELKPNSQTIVSMKDTILIANNDPIQLLNLKNQTISQKLCHFCKLPNPQIPGQKQSKNIVLSLNQEFDNNIKFDEKLILYKTSKLTDLNMLVQIVSPGLNDLSQSSLKIINHASYLTPVKIPTTIAKFETISCKLIGLRLPDYGKEPDQSDIFAAVLVYNVQQQSVEIELI